MITNLLFDLGGVIMNIRRQDCVEAFERLGLKDADSLLGEYQQAGIFAGIENGTLSVDEFHNEIRRMTGREVSDHEIDEAFCKFLTGIPEHRLLALEQLHKRFNLYLLSNTNPIMWNTEIDRQFRKLGHDINYYFDGAVTSFEAKVMKPDPGIFREAILKFGLQPSETIFLDDSEGNCAAAQKLGFNTIHVAPGKEMIDLLKSNAGIK